MGDRGGASEALDIAFAHGRIDASDGRDLGYTAAPYAVHPGADAIEFEAETRSPGGVRRFKGRVAGGHIEGKLVLMRDGVLPTFSSFGGQAI
jgi:hypothetical protein